MTKLRTEENDVTLEFVKMLHLGAMIAISYGAVETEEEAVQLSQNVMALIYADVKHEP